MFLLNLLNELRRRDKMRGLPSISSLFRNEFNTFNFTGAQKLFGNHVFGVRNLRILPYA